MLGIACLESCIRSCRTACSLCCFCASDCSLHALLQERCCSQGACAAVHVCCVRPIYSCTCPLYVHARNISMTGFAHICRCVKNEHVSTVITGATKPEQVRRPCRHTRACCGSMQVRSVTVWQLQCAGESRIREIIPYTSNSAATFKQLVLMWPCVDAADRGQLRVPGGGAEADPGGDGAHREGHPEPPRCPLLLPLSSHSRAACSSGPHIATTAYRF